MLGRIADRGRAQDELRSHPIESTDPLQATDDIGHMGTKDPAIGVHLIDDDKAQVLEELRPLGVMRQDRLVEHVRIADHHIAIEADRLPGIARRIAIEGGGPQAEVACRIEFQQLSHLILGQRLGGEQVKRFGTLLHGRTHHGQRVAQGLARGGGCGHDQVTTLFGRLPGLGLVGIQRGDASRTQRCSKSFR